MAVTDGHTLRLIREPSIDATTFGVLFLDGHFFGFTLEDQIREVPGAPVSAWKVRGQTAIPQGVYPIAMTLSNRFQRVLPLLEDVPGFSGIRIHSGNVIADTEGCLLVGMDRIDRKILRSRVALEKLIDTLGPGPHRILIENPQVAA